MVKPSWCERAGITIPTSDKADFNSKFVRRDKDSINMLINGTIYQEDFIGMNVFTKTL